MPADKVYRAEMGPPPMPDEGAPGPMTEKQRMGNVRIGSEKDVTPAQRKEIERNMPMEPVSNAKGGKISSASSRADGIASRGKTKGTYV